MSLNPADLESALEELRSERPREAYRNQLLSSLRQPPKRLRTRSFVTAAAVVASLLLLYPRRAEGIGWAVSRDRTARVKSSHQTWYQKGKVIGESWVDGNRLAQYSLNNEGSVEIEWRTDGKRRFFYLGFPWQKRQPNTVRYATVAKERRHHEYRTETPLEEILKNKLTKVLGQETIDTPEGKRVRYRIETAESRWDHSETVVLADPATGLIRRMIYSKDRESRIDYPDALPESVFVPKAQTVKDVLTYDIERLWPAVQSRMRHGMGREKGVTLRLVALDGAGSVWIFWTGHLPDGKLSRPAKLPGVPTSAPFGPKRLTSSFVGNRLVSELRISGERLGGMGLTPKVRIGERLPQVVIPTPRGNAVFRNVPVLRISSIGDFGLY